MRLGGWGEHLAIRRSVSRGQGHFYLEYGSSLPTARPWSLASFCSPFEYPLRKKVRFAQIGRKRGRPVVSCDRKKSESRWRNFPCLSGAHVHGSLLTNRPPMSGNEIAFVIPFPWSVKTSTLRNISGRFWLNETCFKEHRMHASILFTPARFACLISYWLLRD